jgi:hypothetical protein
LITADTFQNAQTERLAALLHPIVRFLKKKAPPFLTGLPRLQSHYIRDTDAVFRFSRPSAPQKDTYGLRPTHEGPHARLCKYQKTRRAYVVRLNRAEASLAMNHFTAPVIAHLPSHVSKFDPPGLRGFPPRSRTSEPVGSPSLYRQLEPKCQLDLFVNRELLARQAIEQLQDADRQVEDAGIKLLPVKRRR